jgi:glycine/D-amino acid oxidase-like deaminating enzyme/nitrite reductase/ring-hydroxylating ferredoxin subunit
MNTTPAWQLDVTMPAFPRLSHDLSVDVVIVGGGLTGLTTAYLLQRDGHKVAVIERDRCGAVDTGHTTAHLTALTDARLYELIDTFREEAARDVWEAGTVSIQQIACIVDKESIACDFRWLPGHLHAPLDAPNGGHLDELQREMDAVVKLRIPAGWKEDIPGLGVPGIQFPKQALFHPMKYLAGLAHCIVARGGHVFEQTEAEEFESDPLKLKAGGHEIRSRYRVLATHTPLQGSSGTLGALLFQTKLSLYTSYAVGAMLPPDACPAGLYWDTADPYNYLRVEPREGNAYAVFGGEDHKTGQDPDTEARYGRLTERLRRWLPGASVDCRWSGQVIETHDGLPYIGETAEGQFVGTGFAGNGMTFGTLTAMMAVDAVNGRTSRWQTLFDVSRRTVLGGAWSYVKENKDYPWHMLRDWLTKGSSESIEKLPVGTGRVYQVGLKKVAAYRDPDGEVTVCSAVCPHLQCIVDWNPAEETWDCPCHGSRFKPTGEVISGPAEQPLDRVAVGKAEVCTD